MSGKKGLKDKYEAYIYIQYRVFMQEYLQWLYKGTCTCKRIRSKDYNTPRLQIALRHHLHVVCVGHPVADTPDRASPISCTVHVLPLQYTVVCISCTIKVFMCNPVNRRTRKVGESGRSEGGKGL